LNKKTKRQTENCHSFRNGSTDLGDSSRETILMGTIAAK
jgi:hypothetical protein